MFYARREPFRTNLDKAPDYPKSYSSGPLHGGNAPTLLDPIKSPQLPEAGTHFWKTTRRLLDSRERHLIFVAENWVVIQVGAGHIVDCSGGYFFRQLQPSQ